MLAYLQLLRLPTVFTAMADIIAGFVLTQRFLYGPKANGSGLYDVGWHEPGKFAGLLVASSCLYLSGMVLNDLFDVKQDREERPNRPIPSGKVSMQSAAILGFGLMGAGILAAAFVGQVSLQVAIVLALAILSYDVVLKKTVLGPVAMGSCRFFNILLGASIQPDWTPSLLASPQLAAAVGLGLYIVGVTTFARTEAKVSNRWQLALAQFFMNMGFITDSWLIAKHQINSPIAIPLAMLAVVAFTINRRAFEALKDPSPAKVQGSIKVMLLSLVFIDATLVFWYLNTPEGASYGAAHALATAALVIPALLLSRAIPMT